MKRFMANSAWVLGIGLGCLLGGGVLSVSSSGWAKDIIFVARETEDQQAVWIPREIVIHQNTDFTEPLVFRLDNPTQRTHVFEAPALFESVEEAGVHVTRSVRITIPPEGTEQTVIDRGLIVRDLIAAEGESVIYRFYCPLHRADTELGGRIVVEQ